VTVTVVLPGALADDAGGLRRLAVEVDDGARVSDVLDRLAERYPRLERRVRDETRSVRRYVNLYVGQHDVRWSGGLATVVREGDTLTVLPSVAGG
jgi:MoaD family protein